MKARRSWINVLQKLRDQGLQPRLLYPAMLAFTIDGESKIFQDKNRFKEYVTTNPALKKILEKKSQTKEANNTHNNTRSDNPPPARLKKEKHTNTTTKKNNRTQQPLDINIA